MKKIKKRKIVRAALIVLLAPIGLFLLLAVLLYLPPVQKFVVDKVAESLTEGTGRKAEIDAVRLAFPLDLSVQGIRLTEGCDTLVAAGSLRLDVRLLPLLSGRADIDGFALSDARLNTKSLIADTYVRGHIDRIEAQSHGVEWGCGGVVIDNALLRGADLSVALSDTAREEPDTAAAMPWVITVKKVRMENVNARLSLPGDSLRMALLLGDAELQGGLFDTGRPYYAVRSLTLHRGGLTYAGRSVGGITRRRGNTAFSGRGDALLWNTFSIPEGIDPSYINISDLAFRLDTLSYAADGTLRAGLRTLSLREHSGLAVSGLSGSVYMDSLRLSVPALRLRTPLSRVDAALNLYFRALKAGSPEALSVNLDADLAPQDIRVLARGYVDASMLGALPDRNVQLRATASGNVDRLRVSDVEMTLTGRLTLTGDATAEHVLDDDRRVMARFALRAPNADFVQAFLPAESRGSFAIPRGAVADGTLSLQGERYEGRLNISAVGGRLEARARYDGRTEGYNVALRATAFPLGRFVPGSGLAPFSGRLDAQGAGFDLLSGRARMEAQADIRAFRFEDYDLSGLSLKAKVAGRHATADFASTGPLIEGTGRIEAEINKDIKGRLTAALPNIDLQKLTGAKDTLALGTDVDIDFGLASDLSAYRAEGGIRHIRFLTPRKSIPAQDLLLSFTTDRDTTMAHVSAGDLALRLEAKEGIDRLGAALGNMADQLSRQMAEQRVDAEALKATFPTLCLILEAGQDNPLSKILRYKGLTFSTVKINLDTDPHVGLSGKMNIGALVQGSLLLDTIDVTLFQDSTGIKMNGDVKNYTKRNPNKFEVHLSAFLLEHGGGVGITFLDQKREKGIDLGLRADLADDGVKLSITPHQPVIAYRKFTVNEDNYISLGKDSTLRANVNLLADDGTGLRIYGEPTDSINDLTVSINQLNLGELSQVLPFLPSISGMLDSDFHLIDNHESLSLAAMAKAKDFTFEGIPIGTLGLEAIYLPKEGGEHYANAYVSYEDREVLECEGTYEDRDGGVFDGRASLHDFPLQMLNGFLAGTDIALQGKAGGELIVKDSLGVPVFDGALDLDSAYLYSDVYGFKFRMDDRPVAIEASRMLFKDYALTSHTGGNPLVMNGVLDMSNFDRISLDFDMQAHNFEVINAKKTSTSMVFGKVFADYSGTLRGTVDNLSIRGKLNVLDRTDMTYILKDSPLTVEDRLGDLVQFVSFEDTLAVVPATVTPEGGFDMTLGISVSDAARFHCNLSEDGENYVDLEGGGDLTLRLTRQGEMRLTGRFTAGSGEMKYSLPVIPLKTFNIVPGSYVDFTGDVMNPTLSIAAKERLRATVTENDQPRSVNFDVGVAITKPLSSMGLEFTIEAPEDLGVQNQLAAMTPAQRGKTAVAMLATGMYMTDEMLTTGGSGFKAGNALNAFLQSEIQSIAGSALKTIDISIGMENGTSSTGAETTDYSFQFAKRFWNNRVSVIIGGRVSTGADAQNSAESIIDNVAIEYRLDKSASRYVKVFYDRNSQDPLEGQLIKTGAGVVLRRKTNRLGDLFIFRSSKKDKK